MPSTGPSRRGATASGVGASGLVCSRCKKSFGYESSFKRHGYYCASKQAGPPTSRKRSCNACSKAKVRCDSKLPQCSNCISKDVACQYDESVLRSRVATANPASVAENSSGGEVTNQVGAMESIPEMFSTNETALDPSFMDFQCSSTSFELQSVAKNNYVQLSDLQMTTAPWDSANPVCQVNQSIDEYFETPSFCIQAGMFERHPLSPTQYCSYPFLEFGPSTPQSISTPETARPLLPRSMKKGGAQMSAFFLSRMLRSWPEKMMRTETFPPFIHPKCFQFGPGHDDPLPEALVNCMSLAQMFHGQTKETSKLVWRTIRMEIERLRVEYYKFGDWELLASAQASMIYLLMRMADGEIEMSDLDIPLLVSLNATSGTLTNRVGGEEFKESPLRDQQQWKEWIFHESRRRLVTVARILNKLINIDRAVTCYPLPGFAIVPLPAKKVLWEAPDVMTWRAEFNQILKEREIFGLLEDGQLAKLQLQHGYMGFTTSPANWESWYAGMDEFGTIIMVASALL